MGYYSRVRGAIKFSPGLTIDEIRRHPILRKFEENSSEYPDLEFRTYGGELVDTVECVTTDSFKAYDVQDNLEEIVAALQDRTFSGRLEIYGEEHGDIYGYRIKDGIVVQIEPELVWPED